MIECCDSRSYHDRTRRAAGRLFDWTAVKTLSTNFHFKLSVEFEVLPLIFHSSSHLSVSSYSVHADTAIKVKVTGIDGFPPIPDVAAGQLELQYAMDLFQESEKLFEFKFPRFSYRYKY